MRDVGLYRGPVNRGYLHGPGSLVRAGQAVRRFAQYNPGLIRIASRLPAIYGGAQSAHYAITRGVQAGRQAAQVARSLYSGAKRTQSTIEDYFGKRQKGPVNKNAHVNMNKRGRNFTHPKRLGRKSYKQQAALRNRRF